MTIVQTRFLVETEQIRVVRRTRRSRRSFCGECGRNVRMLTPIDAASLMNVPPGRIYSLIRAAAVHYCLSDDNSPLVCLSSLSVF